MARLRAAQEHIVSVYPDCCYRRKQCDDASSLNVQPDYCNAFGLSTLVVTLRLSAYPL
jgi:hypothetical protein